MLHVLLVKDLRRARRNPLPWLLNLAMPLLITALIGLAFGSRSDRGGLGRIRFALVDEDDSPVTRFLRGGLTQDKAGEHLDPVLLPRPEALRQLGENQLSAVLVIPSGFTRQYLTTTNVVTIELIKNPAQSLHPAVLEELLGAVVTALDVLKRHLGNELADWQTVFDGGGDHRRVAELIVRAGDKFEAAKRYLAPPLISYTRATRQGGDAAASAGSSAMGAKTSSPAAAPPFNLFGFLLPGLASMFLLFLGNTAMNDLRHEYQRRTLARIRTVQHRLLPWVASKVAFSIVMLLLAAAIMLGGGGVVFRIDWRAPLAVLALVVSYCTFAAGFTALLGAALIRHERADAFATMMLMGVGLAGGGAFPAQQLPGLIRDHISPWLPNHWFIETVRGLTLGNADVAWGAVALKTAVLGVVLMVVAAGWLQRRLARSGPA